MRPAPVTGDLALTARAASAETFAPYGRLLSVGDRASLGGKGRVLVTLDAVQPGPRRFAHLQRYPHARRLLLPLGDLPLLLVVLGPGDSPAGPPAAFRTAPGQGVLLEAGVWHAEPLPLAEGSLCEILETRGVADRFDRWPVADLAGVEGLRVQLPEEPGVPRPGLDLDGPSAVLIEEALLGRVVVGLLLLEGLEVPPEHPELEAEADRVADAFRQLGGGRPAGTGVHGAGAIRSLWKDLGFDPAATPPPYEAWARSLLEGQGLDAGDALTASLRLFGLKNQILVTACEATSLTTPLQLRCGRVEDTLHDPRGRPVPVTGVPVLCDVDGPFLGPAGPAKRVRLQPGVHRALVSLYLPPATEEGDVLALLEEVSEVVRAACGGREAGRLVV